MTHTTSGAVLDALSLRLRPAVLEQRGLGIMHICRRMHQHWRILLRQRLVLCSVRIWTRLAEPSDGRQGLASNRQTRGDRCHAQVAIRSLWRPSQMTFPEVLTDQPGATLLWVVQTRPKIERAVSVRLCCPEVRMFGSRHSYPHSDRLQRS